MQFPLSEYFSSFQGEGKFTGIYSLFLRFSECNFRCSFCDTTDRLGKVNHELSLDDILKLLKDNGHRHLVITGGEPFLYPDHLQDLQVALDGKSISVEVETNGSLDLKDPLRGMSNWHYNISPKVLNSDAYEHLYSPRKRIYKFPLSPDNYDATVAFIERFEIATEEIYVMPLAATRDEYDKQAKFVCDKAIQHRWNFSSRLQLLHNFK
jgi:7-carboxy-7-deazaguanine synthase